MNLRDKECTTVGCSVPAEFCEARRKVPWSRGGNTDKHRYLLLPLPPPPRPRGPRLDHPPPPQRIDNLHQTSSDRRRLNHSPKIPTSDRGASLWATEPADGWLGLGNA